MADDPTEELLGRDVRVVDIDGASVDVANQECAEPLVVDGGATSEEGGGEVGEPARVIGLNWPGGFHHLYAELSAAFASGAPDFAAMAEAAHRHGAEILGPPLAVLLDANP